MKITLTPAEAENYFYNSLCNSLDYIQSYGLQLDFNDDHYNLAKANLKKIHNTTHSQFCFEDVLMQILRDGNSLTLIDIECEGEFTRSITLKDVHEQVENTDFQHLQDAIDQTDDATTGDVILQQVFFKELIFG